ncbi:hypothetical protein D9M72_454180 [compost metagenome]
MTSLTSAPGSRLSATLLKEALRSKAAAKASRPIQRMPKRSSSGISPPGAIAYTNSGLSAVPTICIVRLRPRKMASKLSPGSNRWASAKGSLTTTSSGRVGSTKRPERSTSAFKSWGPRSGREITCATTGSRYPATLRMARSSIRVSTSLTPGISAMSRLRYSGTRLA